MLLRIVAGNRLLKMRSRGRKLTAPKERVSHGSVRLDEEGRVLRTGGFEGGKAALTTNAGAVGFCRVTSWQPVE
jgi:hypothetical protein